MSFRRFALTAKPGERHVYFRGNLAGLRHDLKFNGAESRPPRASVRAARDAGLAYELAMKGRGHLFQTRIGDSQFEYIYVAGRGERKSG